MAEKVDASQGADLIAAERQRQIEQEGYTPQHDREHSTGALQAAARCYLMPPSWRVEDGRPPVDWPWKPEFWKPTPGDRLRELVKAGALIAAEIDRLSS